MSTEVASLKIKVDTSDTVKATNDLNKLTNTAKQTDKQVQGLTNAFFSLKGAIATLGVAQTAQYFVKTADSMNLLNARLKLTTSSMEEFNSQQKQLLAISLGTHTSLSDTVTLYNKLDPALKQIGATTSQVNSVVESFTKGLQLGGASVEESKSAIQQFGQAMGSGVLRGEEFNAMAEASPKLLKYLADGLGVPQTALRKMAEAGELTAVRVSNALLKMKSDIDRDFTSLPLTVGKSTTDALTLLSLGIENVDNAFGITKSLALSIQELSSNIGGYSQSIITFFQDINKYIDEHQKGLTQALALVGGVAGAYFTFIAGGAVVAGIGAITEAIVALRIAMLSLQTSIPVLGWISAAVGVSAAVYIQNMDDITESTNKNIKTIEDSQKALDELAKKRQAIKDDKFMLDSNQEKAIKIIDDQSEAIRMQTIALRENKFARSEVENIFGDTNNQPEAILRANVKKEPSKITDTSVKEFGKELQKALDEKVLIENQYKKFKDELDNSNKATAEDYVNLEKWKTKELKDLATKQGKDEKKILEDKQKAYKDINKAGLDEYAKGMQEIVDKTVEWTKLGASENDILAAKTKLVEELNKKTNLESLKEELSYYEKTVQLQQESYDKQVEIASIQYTNNILAIEESNKTAEQKKKLIDLETELYNKTLDRLKVETDKSFKETMDSHYADMLDKQIALNNAVYDYGNGFDGVAGKISKLSKTLGSMSNLELQNKKEVIDLNKKYAKDYETYGKDAEKTTQLQVQEEKDKKLLAEQYTQSQLKNYSLMADAMSSMFKEGSREAASFQAASTALALVEATRAILTQGTGDPYTAIPRMVAMAAMVGSLMKNIGVAFGMNKTTTSSDAFSAQSANTGTGSVLGDTKKASDSISNSLSILEDFAKPNFRLATSMDESLKSIDSKIGGVTSLLIQNSATALGTNYTGGYDTGFKNNLGFNNTLSTLGVGAAGLAIAGATGGFGALGALSFAGPAGLALLGIDKLLLGGAISNIIGGAFNSVLGGLFGKTSVSQALTDSGIYFADAYLKDAVEQLNGQVYQTISTTTTKKSWFSSSSSTSISSYFSALDSEISNQFSLVLGSIYDTVYQAGLALNLSSSSLENSLNSFIVSIGKISLYGKTGDQIQELLTNIFSGISDNLAKAVVPALSEFQAVGEGMFETLTRVATGMEQANYYIGRLGSTFETIDFTDIINKQGVVGFEALYQSILKVEKGANFNYILSTLSGTAEELYSAYIALDLIRDRLTFFGKGLDSLSASMIGGAGSLESLSDGIQSYIENFYSDTEQQALKISELTQLLNRAGITEIPTSINGFRKLVESIDTTSEAGQYLYGNLISLSGAFSDVYSEIDSQRTSLLGDITNFVKELRGTTSSLNAGTTFKTFADSFNLMIDAINNGSTNLSDIGATTLTTAQSYLDTVSRTATSAADLKFAQQIVANKLESVATAPNINLGTINDTLKISFNENSIIVNELKQMRTQLEYLNGLNTTQTATQLKTLSATRALIS